MGKRDEGRTSHRRRHRHGRADLARPGPGGELAQTAGRRSGIHRITRFPIAQLRTTIAGTVDFVSVEEPSAPALTEAVAKVVARKPWRRPASAPRDVPRPPPARHAAGRDGMAAAPRRRRWRRQTTTATRMDRWRADGRFAPWHEVHVRLVAEHLADRFGTKGSPIGTNTACASGGTAIQLGVEAIRRGECRGGAVRRHRCLDQPGEPDPLFAAVGAVHPQRSAGRPRRGRSARIATGS